MVKDKKQAQKVMTDLLMRFSNQERLREVAKCSKQSLEVTASRVATNILSGLSPYRY